MYPVRHKWFKIGQQLKVLVPELHTVKRYHPHDDTDCLAEVLYRWLTCTYPSPTWSDLVKTLRVESVGEMRLADDIEKKHCPRGGEQRAGPEAGEVCINYTSCKAGIKM